VFGLGFRDEMEAERGETNKSVLGCVGVLQCVAVCYSVLQCVAVCCCVYCSELQRGETHESVLQSVVKCCYVCCSVLQYVAVCAAVCVAVCCREEGQARAC